MATGEHFKRLHWAKGGYSERNYKKVVDKKEEQKINAEIKKLQDERTAIYNNDDIEDEELAVLEKIINNKITGRINF